MMDGIRRELGDLFTMLLGKHFGDDAPELKDETTGHKALNYARDCIHAQMQEIIAHVPGFANYLFGTRENGGVRLAAYCGDGQNEYVRVTPTVGTHDLLITLVRVPKETQSVASVTLTRVAEAVELVDARRQVAERAATVAQNAGMGDEIGHGLAKDREMYALVTECLQFLHRLLEVEHEKETAKDAPAK